MNIYKAEKKDIIDLCDLWLELQNHHRNLAEFTPEVKEWRKTKEKELLLVLESRGSQIFIARDSNVIAGYIRGSIQEVSPVFQNSRQGKIDEIYIKEAYRRQNAGKMLVDYMKLWLKGKGVTEITLHVSIDNTTAKSFWEGLGFESTALRMSTKI